MSAVPRGLPIRDRDCLGVAWCRGEDDWKIEREDTGLRGSEDNWEVEKNENKVNMRKRGEFNMTMKEG